MSTAPVISTDQALERQLRTWFALDTVAVTVRRKKKTLNSDTAFRSLWEETRCLYLVLICFYLLCLASQNARPVITELRPADFILTLRSTPSPSQIKISEFSFSSSCFSTGRINLRRNTAAHQLLLFGLCSVCNVDPLQLWSWPDVMSSCKETGIQCSLSHLSECGWKQWGSVWSTVLKYKSRAREERGVDRTAKFTAISLHQD